MWINRRKTALQTTLPSESVGTQSERRTWCLSAWWTSISDLNRVQNTQFLFFSAIVPSLTAHSQCHSGQLRCFERFPFLGMKPTLWNSAGLRVPVKMNFKHVWVWVWDWGLLFGRDSGLVPQHIGCSAVAGCTSFGSLRKVDGMQDETPLIIHLEQYFWSGRRIARQCIPLAT